MFDFFIRKAKYIYILDADLSNRCINYYTSIINQELKKPLDKENSTLIINKFMPFKNYNVKYCEYEIWTNKLFYYLE